MSTDEFANAPVKNYPDIASLSVSEDDPTEMNLKLMEGGVHVEVRTWIYKDPRGYQVKLFDRSLLTNGAGMGGSVDSVILSGHDLRKNHFSCHSSSTRRKYGVNDMKNPLLDTYFANFMRREIGKSARAWRMSEPKMETKSELRYK